MFNIVNVVNEECIIYKSGFIDAARCILKGSNDDDIKIVAETEIKDMFSKMISAFNSGNTVRMYYLKRKDSDYIDFSSIHKFRLWLIENQNAETIEKILHLLRAYCNKNKIEYPGLCIAFGDYEASIYNTDMYFNNTYNKHWLSDDLVKQIIKDVDKSEVLDENVIKSPVFGLMPVEKLSGGVKTLMLIYNNPDMVFNASTCGDNCAKWISKFAEQKDFVINLYHAMNFPGKSFKAYIVNNDKVINSMEELYICADEFCRGK
ncbi:DUF4869 domain-containing protein [Butyrivibrio sp. AD3002]|uniref:DUF4869 domain-containing protein n=1 Tax=Butyrivibrio sp. AD3002 TaxID=1280670 RepID=UPI0003B326FD|nr:DUF4869 domain-containing protein [Butyrivibrio sp. AD3002]